VSEPPEQRGPRLRELGLRIGDLEAGPTDSVADVAGVQVGHVTTWRDEPEPPAGRGVARTGVTAIVPGELPLPAGVAVLNGAGELTASHEIREWGLMHTPVYLTSTMAVGRIYDGAVSVALAADPRVGVDDVVIPVVGECDDSHLSDARTVQVEAADAGGAVDSASGWPIAEGAVGAGTGMSCLGWKGGIGTASRVVPGCTLGALVLANFGSARQLRVAGVPAGPLLGERNEPAPPAGSCIVVLATDAPLAPSQLERVARRAGLGLARTGSVAHHGSGEIFLAFATSHDRSTPDSELNPLFEAAVDATEEAVLNALWAAPDVHGREGRLQRGLPHDEVLELLRRHRVLA
jgi:D-aminopeptidase